MHLVQRYTNLRIPSEKRFWCWSCNHLCTVSFISSSIGNHRPHKPSLSSVVYFPFDVFWSVMLNWVIYKERFVCFKLYALLLYVLCCLFWLLSEYWFHRIAICVCCYETMIDLEYACLLCFVRALSELRPYKPPSPPAWPLPCLWRNYSVLHWKTPAVSD